MRVAYLVAKTAPDTSGRALKVVLAHANAVRPPNHAGQADRGYVMPDTIQCRNQLP